MNKCKKDISSRILPDDFLNRLKKGKVIPFVGAGIPMNVKDKDGNRLFPGWRELLEKSIEELKKSDNEPDANIVYGFLNRRQPDYLQAARFAREGLGADWNNFLDAQFNPDRENVDESSLEIGKLIWGLGSPLVITTNYDKVLRWTNNSTEIWDIESRYRQGKVLSEGLPKQPTVWHLHGYIENPSDLILTPDGYQKLYPNDNAKAEAKYQAALAVLRNLIASYSFLFIGFSFGDAQFSNQIREITDLFDGGTSKHFVLVEETAKNQIDNLNLPVKPITYKNHGEPLLELLRETIRNLNPMSINTQDRGTIHIRGNNSTKSIEKNDLLVLLVVKIIRILNQAYLEIKKQITKPENGE